MTKHWPYLLLLAPTLLAPILSGCEKREVSSYNVKKSQAPAPPVSQERPSTPDQQGPKAGTAAASPGGQWPLPNGWRQLPGAKPMRLATFQAGEGADALEVVLSEFPGDAGGLLPNINRWRAQLSLPAATLEQVQADSNRIDVPPVAGYVVHLWGESAHMLGAVLHDSDADRTRFLKATGAPALLESHKAAFEQFARSLAAMKEGG
jgi:hypothetical protein